jgi:flagellar hook-associated protein 3 FlgL
MTINSVSDLAQSLLLRRDNAKLRQELLTASRELATGTRADLVRRFNGDFGPLAGVETGIRKAEIYLDNLAEQSLRYGAAQAALETIRDSIAKTSGPLILVQETSDAGLVRAAGRDALARFGAVVSNLNSSAGGASLFSGVALDSPALASASTLLDAIEIELTAAGATTATDVAAAVDTWFAAGGGFDTLGYLGGTAPGEGVPVSQGAIAEPLPTAADPVIRRMLSDFAKAALIGRGVLDGAPEEQARLARDAGLRLLSSDEGMVELQSEIGIQENRMATAETETRTRQQALEIARSELVGADPYDAATRLQTAEARLESLYAMTARLSALSLTDYLR